jgi:GH18 family chitinase
MKLYKIFLTTSIFLVFCLVFTAQTKSQQKDITVQQANQSTSSSMFVTGYYPYWALWTMPPSSVDYSALTHLIVFSYDPDPTTSPYFSGITRPQDSINWHQYGTEDSLIAQGHRNGVKMLMCIGGIYGTGASDMYAVNSDSIKTQIYVDALLGYARRHGYDGVDVDWEFPPSNAEGRTRFMRLMRILRRGLDTWNPKGVLTIAAPAWTDNQAYDMSTIGTIVDQINIMSYDFYLGLNNDTWFNGGLKNNTNLYSGTSGYWNWTNHGADQWITKGIPASRLAMGIPFYSWKISGADGPKQTIGGRSYGNYNDAVTALNQFPNSYHWDDSAKAPWIGYTDAGNVKRYITYDDTNSVREKVKWCKNRNLGGVMLYELVAGWLNSTYAIRDPLLKAVKKEVNNPTTPPNVPQTPTLLLPSDKSTNQSLTLTLQWNPSTGANSYAVQVSNSSSFATIILDQSNITSTSQVMSGLTYGTTYYWRVNATNTAGTSGWSNPVFNFTTMVAQPPATPTLATPQNGATGVVTSPTLNWNTSIGVISYQLQVSNNQSFTSTIYNQSNITGTSQSVSGLDYLTTYYWRVNATNTLGTSTWSTVWSFNTDSVHSNPQGDEIKLYDDSLRTPWNNTSWSSTIILSSNEQVYRGIYSIKAVSSAWGALRVISGSWNVPVNTDISGYDSLKLNIYSTTSGLTLRIYIENTAAQSFPQVTISNLPLNQWRTISIPVSQLNPNQYPVNFVTIQNYTGSEKTFYTDELTFHANSKTPVLYSTEIPENFSLKQNYPNPFNPSTKIKFTLPDNALVTLKVYDVIGKEVETLTNNEFFQTGNNEIEFSAKNLPSGVYFYRIVTEGFGKGTTKLTESKRMLLMK